MRYRAICGLVVASVIALAGFSLGEQIATPSSGLIELSESDAAELQGGFCVQAISLPCDSKPGCIPMACNVPLSGSPQNCAPSLVTNCSGYLGGPCGDRFFVYPASCNQGT